MFAGTAKKTKIKSNFDCLINWKGLIESWMILIFVVIFRKVAIQCFRRELCSRILRKHQQLHSILLMHFPTKCDQIMCLFFDKPGKLKSWIWKMYDKMSLKCMTIFLRNQLKWGWDSANVWHFAKCVTKSLVNFPAVFFDIIDSKKVCFSGKIWILKFKFPKSNFLNWQYKTFACFVHAWVKIVSAVTIWEVCR